MPPTFSRPLSYADLQEEWQEVIQALLELDRTAAASAEASCFESDVDRGLTSALGMVSVFELGRWPVAQGSSADGG